MLPIQTAVDAIGTQSELAARLSVHPTLVSQWITQRRPVAAHHCIAIEEATGVSRHALRPDVFGAEPVKHTRNKVVGKVKN